MKKIDIEQAEPIRKKFAPDWEIRKGTYLYKKVAFNDYNQMLRFLMAIEKPQIKLDHFADFMNFYNELTIAITTHDVKGLTQLDFELALYIDKTLEQMDARQVDESLKEDKKEKMKGFDPETVQALVMLKKKFPHASDPLDAMLKQVMINDVESDTNDRSHDKEIDDLYDKVNDLEKKIKRLRQGL